MTPTVACLCQVKNETFMRFRLTDNAEKLAAERPNVLTDDDDPKRKELEAAIGHYPSAFDMRRQLRDQLVGLAERMGCERATVWIVNQEEERLWNSEPAATTLSWP